MANHSLTANAIKAINQSARFSLPNDDIDLVVWLEDTSPISKSDVEAKIVELQAEYDALEWKRNRQKEYPNHEDCIHALLDGGDTLTDLQAKRTAVKSKYPKE